MAGGLIPIEDLVRPGEELDPGASLVLRGSPLTIDGVLANADRAQTRFTLAGSPFIAISVDVTVGEWDVDAILARRLDTRRSYAIARAGTLLAAGFALLPTFAAPHYSLVLPSYTREAAAKVIEAFGDVKANPHYKPRRDT